MISQCSTPNPIAAPVDGVWDIKKYLKPHLTNLEGHSKYAVFRFTRNGDGHAELHYKLASNLPWEPQDCGIKIIDVSVINCVHVHVHIYILNAKLSQKHFYGTRHALALVFGVTCVCADTKYIQHII